MIAVYNDEKHEYRYHGRTLLSVSDVLEEAGLKDRVCGDDFYLWVGNATHKAIELYAKGTLDPATVDARIQPRLDAYLRFVRDTGFRMVESEKPYFNPSLGLACKPDLLGVFPNGEECLVEIKSGGIPRWAKLQVAGQDLTIGPPAHRKRYGLSVRGPRPSIIPYNDPDDFTIFTSALNIARWKYKDWRRP
jgi:hypothetical protein